MTVCAVGGDVDARAARVALGIRHYGQTVDEVTRLMRLSASDGFRLCPDDWSIKVSLPQQTV